MAHESRQIAIVGGGLVGSLLTVLLRQRGFDVGLYERRPDMRRLRMSAGRSINLIATSRGLRGLAMAGLREAMIERAAPVKGRLMHAVDGSLSFHLYGRDESEVNYSVSRGELNQVLLERAEEVGAALRFEHQLESVDFERSELCFRGPDAETTVVAERIIAADGANSAVRAELAKAGLLEHSYTDLGHGYKELEIPPGDDGSFRIDGDVLHIWPRGRFMMMALPNHDGSFTITLYLPYEGDVSFDSLDSEQAVNELFEREFADSIPHIPDLAHHYMQNPAGRLGTVRCAPWNCGDKVAVIGDSAHAIVPFFGQGMNSGFEDARILTELIEANGDDWAKSFSEYTEARKVNGDAIADMSLENFNEMCSDVADPQFLLRKSIEHRLANELPDEYRSRYSIVVYSHVPYHQAKEIGVIQRRILDQLSENVTKAEDVDLEQARQLIERDLNPYLEAHDISLDYKYEG